jgi:hypothetical protein
LQELRWVKANIRGSYLYDHIQQCQDLHTIHLP